MSWQVRAGAFLVVFTAGVIAYRLFPGVFLTCVAVTVVAAVGWGWNKTTIAHAETWAQALAAGRRVTIEDRLRARWFGTTATADADDLTDVTPAPAWLIALGDALDEEGYPVGQDTIEQIADVLTRIGQLPQDPIQLQDWVAAVEDALNGRRVTEQTSMILRAAQRVGLPEAAA